MFFFYRLLTYLFFPIIIIFLLLRLINGKENINSLRQKIIINESKNKRKLIWFHGASIGELNSIVPLVNYIINKHKKYKILISSTTLSSKKIFKDKFKNRKIIHRYLPLDIPILANIFIKKWNPTYVYFIDSEIWPNFIYEIKKNNIKISLLNARITKKTLRKWFLIETFAKKIFSQFESFICSNIESKRNLKTLGVKNIKFFGNIKLISEKNKIEKFRNKTKIILDKKFVWCAASTHEGEEDICAKTHIKIKKKFNNVLTIIVPRHINRIEKIKKNLDKYQLKVQIVKSVDRIRSGSEIVLVNSFGILNKFYFYCNCVFIGKSLLSRFKMTGGQNPIEAAKLGSKIYHGRYIYNFKDIYTYLNKQGIAEEVQNYNSLSDKIIENFSSYKKISNSKVIKLNNYGKKVFKKTIVEIQKNL